MIHFDPLPFDFNTFAIMAGAIFKGWNTEKGGSGDTMENRTDEWVLFEDATLYAQWDSLAAIIDVTFDDGSGSVSIVSETVGRKYTLLDAPARTGYDFGGRSYYAIC